RDWTPLTGPDGRPLPRRAAISGFGYGGVNAHLILEEPPPTTPQPTTNGPHVITLSAKTPEALTEQATRLLAFVGGAPREDGDQQDVAPVVEEVRSLAAEVTGVSADDLNVDENLAEYGVDRVTLARLTATVNERYGTALDPAEGSIAALADRVLGTTGAPAGPPPAAADVDLRRLAYTLQVGREPMAERVALIAASVPELRTSLAEFLGGEVRAGAVQDTGRLLTSLLDGPEGERFVRDLVAAGRLPKLADLWVAGAGIDWRQLYGSEPPTRMSLPTYPFERRRCWVGARSEPEIVEDDTADPVERVLAYLTGVFATALGWRPEELDPDAGFDEYGLDSLTARELTARLRNRFPDLSATAMFAEHSLRGLARHLADQYPSEPERRATVAPTAEPIAVIGVSGRYPGSPDLDTYWQNLASGRDCVTEIPAGRWDHGRFAALAERISGKPYCRWGGFLDDVDAFDPQLFSISPIEARYLDPQERLFIQAVWECFEDAGYPRRRRGANGGAGAPIGVFAGVTYNNYQMYAAEAGEWTPVNSQTFGIANRVSYLFDLGGPSAVLDTACSSSLYAVHLAAESIRRGECAAAIAGGVNLTLHPSKYVTLTEGQFTASDGRCHTFGAGGDGYVPAEGVGAVLLKPLSAALADGDRVEAVILGSAVNHDGRTFGFSVPNPKAQAALIRTALDRAGVSPDTISYVEAHGTGTSLGDPIEVQGLTEAFRYGTDRSGYCAIGSAKSVIGHAEAAAGIAALTKVILQLRHGGLAPSPTHSDQLNPEIDFAATPFVPQREPAPWSRPVVDGRTVPRRAGISSFGVGGVNVHLVVEEPPEPAERPAEEPRPELVCLSARTEDSLREYAAALAAYLRDVRPRLSDVALTLQTGREELACRAAFVAADVGAAVRMLDALRTGAGAPGLVRGEVRRGGAAVTAPAADGDPDRLAEAWVAGAEVDWERHHAGRPVRRIPLPTYRFARERYWIVERSAPEVPVSQELPPAPPERLQDYLRDLVGELLGFDRAAPPDVRTGFFDLGMDSVLATRMTNRLEEDLAVELYPSVLFDHPTVTEMAAYLATVLPAGTPAASDAPPEPEVETVRYRVGWEPSEPLPETVATDRLLLFDVDATVHAAAPAGSVLVRPGAGFARLGDGRYEVRPDSVADHERLVAELRGAVGGLPERVIHLWSRSGETGVDAALRDGPLAVLTFARALVRTAPDAALGLLHVYRYDPERPDPAAESSGGLARSIPHESPRIGCATVGVPDELLARPAELLALCAAEFAVTDHDQREARYSANQRWVRRLRQLPDATLATPGVRRNGVYLISGGGGGLGLIFARHLTEKYGAAVVLMSRSALGEARRAELGDRVCHLRGDVTNAVDVDRVVAEVRRRFGRLDGVIHAAGVLRDALLVNKTDRDVAEVLDAKVHGALHLDRATAGDDLDFFVMFSSLAALAGNAGQADYAVANRFLNAFAGSREQQRRAGRRSGRSVAVVWPFWRAGGMGVDEETARLVRRRLGLAQLDTEVGLAAFDAVLAGDHTEGGVLQAERSRFERLLPVLPPGDTGEEIPAGIAAMPLSAVADELEQLLSELTTGGDPIDVS
ncbi:SDR family NAD(P)-dependent oxidoreductase, partial [Actinoplanes aureus]